jgi:hypothetical protein
MTDTSQFKSNFNESKTQIKSTNKFMCGKYRAKEPSKLFFMSKGEGKHWIQSIFTSLENDFSQMKFNVTMTYSDEVVVQYFIDPHKFTPQQYRSVCHYMNLLISHGIGAEYKLRRRGDRWGVLEELDKKMMNEAIFTHSISFSMYAPWVPVASSTVHKSVARFDRLKARNLALKLHNESK